MSKHVDYQQFIAVLQKLIDQKKTNNLILFTEDRHSLWMGLADGVVTSIIFGPKRGKSALPFISRITSGQLSLDTDTKLPPMPDLPPTETILAQLRGSDSPMTQSDLLGGMDTADVNRIIEECKQLLKGYIGPIANSILPGMLKQIDDISSDNGLQTLIDKMAKEVEGIGDVEKFRQDANKIIEKA